MAKISGASTQAAGWGSALAIVATVALLAAMHLPYPLTEDQAAFTYGAREISEGAPMYREFWDIKQPGIYWWFTASGMLFGFDSWGARWMDLCWTVVVAPFLWAAVRQRGLTAAVLGPLLSFTAFYAKASAFHLSQVEWLACGPLAVILWCISTAPRDIVTVNLPQVLGRYALAGAMTALVGIFKTMLVLLPMAMLAVAIIHSQRQGRAWSFALRWQVGGVLLGALAIVAPLVVWMHLAGTLQGALWTAFVYPPQAAAEYAHQTFTRLLWAFHWFRRGNIWLVPWALWAVWNGLRRGWLLELLCLAWACSAAVAISLQVLSYWEYHFDLLFMPLGLLAALGFSDVLHRLRVGAQPRWQSALAWALLLGGVAIGLGLPLARKAVQFAHYLPFNPEQREAFAERNNDRLPVLKASARAVEGIIPPGERIIVWGDPHLYFMTKHRPVLQVNGSAIYLTRQLQHIAELIREQPPTVIYLSTERDRLLFHAGGVVPRTVQELYEPYYKDGMGVWYRLRRRGAG